MAAQEGEDHGASLLARQIYRDTIFPSTSRGRARWLVRRLPIPAIGWYWSLAASLPLTEEMARAWIVSRALRLSRTGF